MNAIMGLIKEINSSIVIKKAEIKDIPKLTEIFNEHYSRKKTDEYFQWMIFDSPFPTVMFLAMDQHCLAACLGVQVVETSQHEKCGFLIDSLTDLRYRNRGLLYLLEKEACNFATDKGAIFMASLPNESGKNAFVSLGWNALNIIDHYQSEIINDWSGVILNLEVADTTSPPIRFLKNESWRYKDYKYERYQLDDKNYCVFKIFDGIIDVVDYKYEGDSKYKDFYKLAEMFDRLRMKDKVETWAVRNSMPSFILQSLGYKKIDRPIRWFCLKDKLDTKWELVPADSEIY